jgi:hypothetical protein
MCGHLPNARMAQILLPQIELTLNMLRPANVRQTISAHSYVHGIHDYNRMPLVPLGCETQCFVDPEQRTSFGSHSLDSWHIGSSGDHYRAYKVFMRETRAKRVTDTIVFKHKKITNPAVSAADVIAATAAKLTDTIKNNMATNLTSLDMHELERLADIFQQAAKKVSETDARTPRVATPPRVPTDHEKDQLQPDATAPRVDDRAPRYNLRSRKSDGNITTDAMLSVMELSTRKLQAQNLATRQFPAQFFQDMIGAVMDSDTGDMLEYRHLLKNPKYRETWSKAFGKEIGRLAQGQEGVVEGTDALHFIEYDEIPRDRRKDVTYARICADYRPEKSDPNCIRITVGGNLVNYPGDVGTKTADLLTVKLLLNSVISTPVAKFMSMDISNFYLMAPMDRPEYVRMNLSDFPDEIIEEYNLRAKAKDGCVIAECKKCVYGLPQAGILANKYLEKRLNEYGYFQSQHTNGLWTHETRPIQFVLCEDDFGVKYVSQDDVEHLKQALTAVNPETGKLMFEISVDEKGTRYCGLFMDWDYDERVVHVLIPGYVAAALKQFKHEKPSKPQHQPYPHNPKQYGSKAQYTEEQDTSPLLDKEDKKFIQEVTGMFLFYAQAVDTTMLTALSSLASEQAAPTVNTMKKCKQFLDYAASQEDAVITYRKSDTYGVGNPQQRILLERAKGTQ